MATKRAAARRSARRMSDNGFQLVQAEIAWDDFEWLASAERLYLWNVKVPPDFLARLEKLWWLTVTGGSANDLNVVRGLKRLKYLGVNQVRGVQDVSSIRELQALRYLDLYGLPRVTLLPSLKAHTELEHVRIGQMRRLTSLGELLQAPNLRELELVRKINVSDEDVDRIAGHPALKQFGWFAEDVPNKVWLPVVNRIGLPKVRHLHPEEWFGISEPWMFPLPALEETQQ